MEILIINQPLNNRGDESAHKALIRALCKSIPNINIKVLFINENQNSVEQFNVNLPNVTYINLPKIKAYNLFATIGLKYNITFLWKLHPTIKKITKIYLKSDYILCAPGGICMGGFQNWMHIFLLKLAKWVKKPLIYYGRSFGPFPTKTKDNRIFKKISLEMLHYFSFLSIRDLKTEKLAEDLNIKYIQTVDSAFLDSPKVSIPEVVKSMIGNKNYMVFVPNSLIWHYAYKKRLEEKDMVDFYKKIILEIINEFPDLNILLLPQTFNYGTKLGDDINFFNEIKESIPNENRIIVIPDNYSSDVQQCLISSAKFLIGARYHSVVFALNNNVPFIALSYEHKISGLLASLNKEDTIIDITNISKTNKDEIVLNITKLLRVIKSDPKAQEEAKNIATECFKKLTYYLKS